VARSTQLAIGLSIFSVAARLILIDQPYIDTWSWRQSDVAAIARNYFQNSFHFAHPQIDWAGAAPGYVGTEFPILPFLAAVAYRFGGVHEWIGRCETVVFFAVSLPFFFLLVRDLFGSTAAIWAQLFYGFAPLNLFAGREFMPDAPSLSLALIGLYFFKRWINDNKPRAFLASACAIALSILIKAPSALTAAPLGCLAVAAVYDRRSNSRTKVCDAPFDSAQGRLRPPLQSLALFAVVVLLPALLWYWHAYSIAQNFYPHHFFGGGGLRLETAGAYERIAAFTTTASLTPILVVLASAGLFLTRSSIAARPFRWWLCAMLLFIIVAGKGNRHPWYQLPLVPVSAAFAGAACAFLAGKISSRRAKMILSILLAGLFCGAAFCYVRPFYRPWATQLRDAGLELRRITSPASLLIAADHGDPTLLYYAGRRGWHLPQKDAIYYGDPADGQQLINNLSELRKAGATHLVFVSTTFWFIDQYPDFAVYLAQSAALTEKTSAFAIYHLKPNE